MPPQLPPFDNECFFITPIGKPESLERRRADGVLRTIVIPAATDVGLSVVRADQIAAGGQVNLQIIEHICKAETAVADLTGGNLNVYYEVGMRHAVRKPVALIADEGEGLAFDLLQQRTLFFANDLEGAASCRDSLREQLEAAASGAIDSPVDAALSFGALATGNETERALADLVTKVDTLTSEVHDSNRRSQAPARRAIHDLVEAWDELDSLVSRSEQQGLAEISAGFAKPIRYLANRYLTPRYVSESTSGRDYSNLRQRLVEARRRVAQLSLSEGSTANDQLETDQPDSTETGDDEDNRALDD